VSVRASCTSLVTLPLERWLRSTPLAVAALALSCWPTPASAHSAGQPGGDCTGCHGSGDYDIAVATNPASFSPGDALTVTVTISSPGGNVAGIFVAANEGSLSTIAGQGLAQVTNGLTHTSPKNMSGGTAQFSFGWNAPNQPGAVRFEVSTLVANDNGSSSGDLADDGQFDFVFGCSPSTYYRDFDGDGYGRDTEPLVHCAGAAPSGYSAAGGDCNDSNDAIHPGATEYCNQVDDDCDGEVDDDAIPLTLYPDADGDGYYGVDEFESGETIVGCVPHDGYAAEPGDCEPEDPEINPGVEEVCNLIDDDCSGKLDEQVRPQCGEGWCRREATTCDPASCVPGEPRAEECNLFDDDCNGIVDNDAPCAAGQSCIAGTCTEGDPPPSIPADDEAPGSSACATDRGPGSSFAIAWLLLALASLARRRR
jgi:uncharacterized protein (TIGR03382 family)